MRYRVWDSVEKEMHYPRAVLIASDASVFGIYFLNSQRNPLNYEKYKPMLFSGFVDKNNNEIWAGDYLRAHGTDGVIEKDLLVKYGPFCLKDGEISLNLMGWYLYGEPEEGSNEMICTPLDAGKTFEIVGNTFEGVTLGSMDAHG